MAPSDRDDIRAPHRRRDDFLGAFGVIETDAGILMVQNRRTIGGRPVLTWDLPGGQVEPGETLLEALVRELREEVSLEVGAAADGGGRAPSFLFCQEGERVVGGQCEYVWRSFFFAVESYRGVPHIPAGDDEILAFRWMQRSEMAGELTAPYHDSFLQWLESGGRSFSSSWHD